MYFRRVVSFSIYLLSSFFLANLSSRRMHVYNTSSTTHGVALVRIYNAGLRCTARGSLKIQDAKTRQKSPSRRHRTTLLDCIFATKAFIDNWKNVLNSNTSSTFLDNMVNFGTLTAEICWRVWGTLANFNGFRVLAALLHSTQVGSVRQTLRRKQRAPPVFGRAAITLGIGPHF